MTDPRLKVLADIVQELARIAGVQPGDSLYTTLERLREVQSQDREPRS